MCNNQTNQFIPRPSDQAVKEETLGVEESLAYTLESLGMRLALYLGENFVLLQVWVVPTAREQPVETLQKELCCLG